MRNYLLVLIFFLITVSINAQNPIEITKQQAIDDYEAKNFDLALENFLKLENEGILQADLLYNIGNCYYRTNQIGNAILYMKKALKLDPTHKQAGRNLDYLLTATRDKQEREKRDWLQSILVKSYNSIPINMMAIILIGLFLAIVLTILWIIFLYRHREKTVPVFFLTIFIILFATAAVMSIMKWSNLNKISEGVIIDSIAIGYSGPSEEFQRVFTIHEGMIFRIEKEENEWSLINLPNGFSGWILTEKLGKVELIF